MIAVSPVPSLLAAMMVRARRKIVQHFLFHHATAPGDAVRYLPQSRIEQAQFDRLMARGVVRDAGSGTYWIDTAAFVEFERAQRRKVVTIVVVVLLIAAALPLFFYRG